MTGETLQATNQSQGTALADGLSQRNDFQHLPRSSRTTICEAPEYHQNEEVQSDKNLQCPTNAY